MEQAFIVLFITNIVFVFLLIAINKSWADELQKQNNEWAEICSKINEDYSDFLHDLVNGVENHDS